jgi:hypothetical protein
MSARSYASGYRVPWHHGETWFSDARQFLVGRSVIRGVESRFRKASGYEAPAERGRTETLNKNPGSSCS